jgi:hypothetical protein
MWKEIILTHLNINQYYEELMLNIMDTKYDIILGIP